MGRILWSISLSFGFCAVLAFLWFAGAGVSLCPGVVWSFGGPLVFHFYSGVVIGIVCDSSAAVMGGGFLESWMAPHNAAMLGIPIVMVTSITASGLMLVAAMLPIIVDGIIYRVSFPRLPDPRIRAQVFP